MNWTFFFSSRRRHTRWPRDWSSDVCSSDLPDVLVEERLDLLDNRAALPGVALPGQIGEELVLFLEAPPARPVALDGGRDTRVGIEREARREDVEELGLAAPLDERRPVEHLEVDLEAHVLHLLGRHEGRVVHPLVLLGGDPAHGLTRVARFLQELARLGLVLLVVARRARQRKEQPLLP